MDCSLPGSSLHGIFQARVLEWVAICRLQGIFPTQGSNPGLPHWRQTLYPLSHQCYRLNYKLCGDKDNLSFVHHKHHQPVIDSQLADAAPHPLLSTSCLLGPVHWKYGGLQDRLLLFKGSIGNVVVTTPASGQLGWNTSRKAYMLSVMFERFGGSRRSII